MTDLAMKEFVDMRLLLFDDNAPTIAQRSQPINDSAQNDGKAVTGQI
jgi:hypothetical protein